MNRISARLLLSSRASRAVAGFLVFLAGCTRTITPPTPSTTPTPVPPPSSAKVITSFIIKATDNPAILTADITASITSDSINLVFAKGVNITNLIPTISFTGKTVSPASKTSQNFGTTLNYIVTAQDSSNKIYHVLVNFVSSDKSITGFSFRASDNSSNLSADVSGFIGADTIALTVPFATKLTALVPYITTTGKTVSPTSLTPQDFTNPVKYTVTATDGTTKTYMAVVTAALPPPAGTIFVAAPNQTAFVKNGYLYAIDAATGKAKWSYYDNSAPIWPAPTVAGGKVYEADFTGNLLAFDQTTGSLLSSYLTSPNNHLQSNPTVVNGTLYIGGADSFFYAVNTNPWTPDWKIKLGKASSGSPTVDNGVVYFANDQLYAVNSSTGAIIWGVNPSSDSSAVYPGNPAVANGIVYFGSSDRNVYAMDAATGHLVWKYYTGDVVNASPTVANGIVYVTGGFDNLYALNAATGTLKWSYSDGYVLASPCVANGSVYIASTSQYLHALDAGTGNLKWSYHSVVGLENTPLYFNGSVIFSSANNLLSVNSTTGTLNWTFSTGNPYPFTGLCAVDTAGNIFHTSDSGDQN
ncbi:outer membrane protein assembly factor BamB family protein [Puia dinghuensis]|uniref:Pyrrolo-quinoline quinone repeat domain-containing protein n=1 Tax=Puia dinghuensis TaxID=1792502 RepID=A0A8J2UHJ5_9BACT|nr:PQQ-binding-like beta-propeller repeat protein [Puia dinghuensis]GGB18625.1 hypothetical protein GCM10011511_48020 [Puia dinghuensis]